MRSLPSLRRTVPAVAVFALCQSSALAKTFERPIPNPQTSTAEAWFLAASLGLILALGAVHWLVQRR